MKKIKKSSELLWLFGLLFVGLGVATCSKADLGVSMIAAPTFVISEALAKVYSGISVGMTEYLLQGVLLVILCCVLRKFKWQYLLSFVEAVIYGYILNFFLWVVSNITLDTVLERWVMLLIGDLFTAFGVACFFRTHMPLQLYELFVTELTKNFKLNIAKTKWVFDITLLVVSIALSLTLFGDFKTFDWSKIYYTSFHSIGLGTLVTTLINSPLISFMGKIIDRFFEPTPLFTKFENLLNK